MNKIAIIDPHFTDELVAPIRSIARGRMAIKKYAYLLDEVLPPETQLFFSGHLSGLIAPTSFERVPKFLKRFLLTIEKLFYRYNGIYLSEIRNAGKDFDAVVFVLRNLQLAQFEGVQKLLDAGVIVYGLCSHAHLLEPILQKLDRRVVLLCDQEIMRMKPFSNFETECISLVPSDKFISTKLWDDRSCKVIAVGTVHRFRSPLAGFVETSDGYFTLHPSRYDINSNGDPEIFEKHLSLVCDTQSTARAQKDYMNLSLTELYNHYRYAVIGSDALTIAANGLFEGMACGCEMFLEEETAHKLGLENGVHVWTFKGSAQSLEERYQSVISDASRLKLDPVETAAFHRRNATERARSIFDGVDENVLQ